MLYKEVMKKKEIEKYVDKDLYTYTDVGPTFSKFNPTSTVYGFGLMTTNLDASVNIEGIFYNDGFYRLQPIQLIQTKDIMPDMGWIWGTIKNIDMDNTYLAFHGFMKFGTPEEFIKLVYDKHVEQLDII